MSEVTPEHWLSVVDPEVDCTGLYEISSAGRFRGLKSGKIHRPSYSNSGGYPMVILTINGKRYGRYIHRMVAAAFLGPCPEGMEVRHKRSDPRNCAASNLEYGTSGDNKRDQVRDGTHPEASKTHCDNGHEFTEKNTRIDLWPDGSFRERVCRECNNARYRDWKARNAASGRQCSRDDCTKPPVAKGLCGTHYAQEWRANRQ